MRLAVSVTLIAALSAAPLLAHADQASEEAAADLLRKRMQTERPDDLKLLDSVKGRHIVVVAGTMDHIERVLDAAKIRYTMIRPRDVAKHDLNADQILMVNCPGNIPSRGVRRIEKFVRAGGLLYTTDWALLNLVQRAFPGTVAHNGASTGDHVTPVRVHAEHDNMMTKMLLRKGGRPQWWLEGGSYPIKIVNSKKVQVLASSPSMGKKYGSAPVVVRFRWDDGEVIHVVSHFYRQIGTQGPKIAAKEVIDDVQGLTDAQKQAFKSSGSGSVDFGDVESSYGFQQMTTNMVVGKQKRNIEIDAAYQHTPTAPIVLEGRAVAPGARVKVIGKKDGKVRIRDDRGNEGEVAPEALQAR